MADRLGIEAAGLSIARLLNLCFEEDQPISASRSKAVLMRSEDFDSANRSDDMTLPMVSIFLYRVDLNRCTRPGWSAIAHQDGSVHIPLDLHFLITPWAANAEFEYRLLGHTISCFERIPILSGPLLYPTADWQPHEALQICMPELTTEDMMRTFDSLPVNYRLSVPYLARVVRLEASDTDNDVPVHHMVNGVKPSLSQ